jgi:hypothetical protein
MCRNGQYTERSIKEIDGFLKALIAKLHAREVHVLDRMETGPKPDLVRPWIYWVGPIAGMLLAVLACSFLAKRIEVAKLYHFDSDRDRLFRRMAMPQSPISARNARETES